MRHQTRLNLENCIEKKTEKRQNRKKQIKKVLQSEVRKETEASLESAESKFVLEQDGKDDRKIAGDRKIVRENQLAKTILYRSSYKERRVNALVP